MIKSLPSQTQRHHELTSCSPLLTLCLALTLTSCRTTTKSENLDDRSNSPFVGEEGATCDPSRGITCRRDLTCKGAEPGQAGYCSK